MNKVSRSGRGVTALQAGVISALAFSGVFIVMLAVGEHKAEWLKIEYEDYMNKVRLVQTMKSELLISAETEKSSIIANTDEEAWALAEQSQRASQQVETARMELERLTEKDGEESKCLDDFTACWKKLNDIDRKILSRAGMNTNLKAIGLSHGPAAGEIKHMEEALDEMMDRAEGWPRHQATVIRLASRALEDAFNIYALQSPHIAETTDTGMDNIEAKMKQRDAGVIDALTRLDGLTDEAGRPLLDEARKAYRNFQVVNEKIIALSRQNSNVRSFEESIGRKREMMTMCLTMLNVLQEKIQEKATFKATR